MLMDLPHLTVIDMAQSFLKQYVLFFRPFAAWELHCGNASDCSKAREREESRSDGKRRLQNTSTWPTSYHCQNLDSRSNKTNFYYSFPYLSCKRVDSSLQWRKASQWSWCAAIRWILALKNWGWFTLCKMQGADITWLGFEPGAQTLLCCRGCSMTKDERKYLWEFKTHRSYSSDRGKTGKRRSSFKIYLRRATHCFFAEGTILQHLLAADPCDGYA